MNSSTSLLPGNLSFLFRNLTLNTGGLSWANRDVGGEDTRAPSLLTTFAGVHSAEEMRSLTGNIFTTITTNFIGACIHLI